MAELQVAQETPTGTPMPPLPSMTDHLTDLEVPSAVSLASKLRHLRTAAYFADDSVYFAHDSVAGADRLRLKRAPFVRVLGTFGR